MKNRHITLGLIALSLIAVTFVATVTAAIIHYPTMTAHRYGKEIIFTILTDTDTTTGIFLASDVDPTTIEIAVWDSKGNPLPPITPNLLNIERIGYTITIQIVKQDGVPAHTSAVSIAGSIVSGVYAGDSFLASGPGWAWGGIHA